MKRKELVRMGMLKCLTDKIMESGDFELGTAITAAAEALETMDLKKIFDRLDAHHAALKAGGWSISKTEAALVFFVERDMKASSEIHVVESGGEVGAVADTKRMH